MSRSTNPRRQKKYRDFEPAIYDKFRAQMAQGPRPSPQGLFIPGELSSAEQVRTQLELPATTTLRSAKIWGYHHYELHGHRVLNNQGFVTYPMHGCVIGEVTEQQSTRYAQECSVDKVKLDSERARFFYLDGNQPTESGGYVVICKAPRTPTPEDIEAMNDAADLSVLDSPSMQLLTHSAEELGLKF